MWTWNCYEIELLMLKIGNLWCYYEMLNGLVWNVNDLVWWLFFKNGLKVNDVIIEIIGFIIVWIVKYGLVCYNWMGFAKWKYDWKDCLTCYGFASCLCRWRCKEIWEDHEEPELAIKLKQKHISHVDVVWNLWNFV